MPSTRRKVPKRRASTRSVSRTRKTAAPRRNARKLPARKRLQRVRTPGNGAYDAGQGYRRKPSGRKTSSGRPTKKMLDAAARLYAEGAEFRYDDHTTKGSMYRVFQFPDGRLAKVSSSGRVTYRAPKKRKNVAPTRRTASARGRARKTTAMVPVSAARARHMWEEVEAPVVRRAAPKKRKVASKRPAARKAAPKRRSLGMSVPCPNKTCRARTGHPCHGTKSAASVHKARLLRARREGAKPVARQKPTTKRRSARSVVQLAPARAATRKKAPAKRKPAVIVRSSSSTVKRGSKYCTTKVKSVTTRACRTHKGGKKKSKRSNCGMPAQTGMQTPRSNRQLPRLNSYFLDYYH